MLEDIISHLEDSHEFIRQNFLNGYKSHVPPIATLNDSDGNVRLTGGMLCDGGWLTLPQDLRLLKCPYCRDNPKMFLKYVRAIIGSGSALPREIEKLLMH